VYHIGKDKIYLSVSQEKWKKGQDILAALREELASTGAFKHKLLLSRKGFLVHLSMTIDFIVPFLKSLHLVTDRWRSKRGDGGWKMSEKHWEAYLFQQLEGKEITKEEFDSLLLGDASDAQPPKTVVPDPELLKHLISDLDALANILGQDEPPQITVRVSKLIAVYYGFGDASGLGFGDSFLKANGIDYCVGVWGSDDEGKSSNYKELKNCVQAIRRQAEAGCLAGSELFFFTDNSTAESAIHKGSSKSPLLHSLLVELRVLQARHGFRLLVCHCSGKRMIAQGTDGVSRGQLDEGVLNGNDMMSYIPLHLSAIQRHPRIESWIKSWLGPTAETLTPEDWFERGHDMKGGRVSADGFWRPTIKAGKFIWAPPPGAALPALEELRKARIKRQKSTHVFVCPRLMTPLWQKQLHKAADIVIVVPIGHSAWPANMFEPLLVGIVFPFIRCDPWQLRGTPKLYAVAGELSALWKTEGMDGRDILRKLCDQCWRARTMPQDVVRRMLYFKSGV
jgi:hypothetical protein